MAYSIILNCNIPPEQEGRCRVLMETKAEIEGQMKEMITQDIITSQVEPLPWIRSTYSHKANPESLSRPKNFKQSHHLQTPQSEHTRGDHTQVSSFNYILYTNLENGFWVIHLIHKSSLLTTFNTHLVRYCFKYFPLSLKMYSK